MNEDSKALKILIAGCWRSKDAGGTDDILDVDLQHAISAGYLFETVHFTHDELVAALTLERDKADEMSIASSFLASLSTRQLYRRSALGSYSFARNFPHHEFVLESHHSFTPMCEICGVPKESDEWFDINEHSFSRIVHGRGCFDEPEYAWHDLKEFNKLPPLTPTNEDREIIRKILAIADSMPPNATPNQLEISLRGVFKSNVGERRTLIEILGYAGVLAPEGRTGYLNEFTLVPEYTGEHRNDWAYPAIWWRGSDGVCRAAVNRLFPGL